MTMANQCTARKKNGGKCSADAQIGKDVCVFHDPEKAVVVRQARQAGGVRRSQPLAVLPPDTPDCQIHDASDIRELLTATINQVRRGELDVRFANTIGYLATIVMGALLEGNKEKRLARLWKRMPDLMEVSAVCSLSQVSSRVSPQNSNAFGGFLCATTHLGKAQ